MGLVEFVGWVVIFYVLFSLVFAYPGLVLSIIVWTVMVALLLLPLMLVWALAIGISNMRRKE